MGDRAKDRALVTCDYVLCIGLFFVTWIFHSTSRVWTSTDSRWTIPTAVSIIDDHTARLDKYVTLIEQNNFYAIDCVVGKTQIRPLTSLAQCPGRQFYNFYPIGIPVLAVPEVYVIRRLASAVNATPWISRFVKNPYRRRLIDGDLVYAHALVEVLIASFWIAVSTVMIYFTSRNYLGAKRSVTLALVFAFCTPAWSTASRALWQHGASMLLISVAILTLLKAKEHWGWLALAGGTLAYAIVARPTNIVVFVVAGLYLMTTRPQQIWIFLVSASPVFAAFVAWSYSVYGHLIAPYYWPLRPGSNSLALHSQFFEALAANLISPGRGLFVYVPIFLLAVLGMILPAPDCTFSSLRPFLIGALLGHWILVSTFHDWWAGFAFGPRYLSDITPLLIFFLIPVLKVRSSKPFGIVFSVLALASFGIQYSGANREPVFAWNRTPVSIDQDPERVWNWLDIAFFR